MHIPNEMLNGSVSSVSAVLAVAGIALAARAACKAHDQPGVLRFAAVSALIFAAQMLNFPVLDGTSGHLLGGVLAAALLGVPFGVLALALVVTVQSLVFADGGVQVLGANLLNMAVLGAGLGGLLHEALRRQGMRQPLALLLAAWGAMLLAAAACAIELALSGAAEAGKVMAAMLGVHALIGIGEGVLTVALVTVLASRVATRGSWHVVTPLSGAVLMAALLSPLASSHPDGLESVAGRLGFLREGAPSLVSPLADYAVAGLGETALSTALAGLAGVFLLLVLGAMLAGMLRTLNVAGGRPAAH
ncbi:energy-coupling factor ABC transporter permease [Chitinilyticum litopenaei]|uniref:energy-coupling factor ABC transporter permease n=1 Tax=Chitinilyticum litopenaei TaxID=1121276 RepID=UPI0004043C67|nr:energy-coupling factor ABC transporter permease [Chitinilyticum litopenaei]